MNPAMIRQFDELTNQLSSEEVVVLIERLLQRVRQGVRSTESQPQDLYGIWKGKFPEDMDLDEALREIRQGWSSEWAKGGEFLE